MRGVLLWGLLLVGQAAFAEEETIGIGLNCGYWNGALAGNAFLVTKVLFVRGAYEGATAFYMDIFDATERAAKGSKPLLTNPQQAGDLFEKRYLRQTSYTMLVAGLDEFCSDSLNESVWLTGAIKVVSMRLRAEPEESITKEIQRLRQEPGP